MTSAGEPAPDCGLCPRLVAFRHQNRAALPHCHNGPVPAFGPLTAPLLVVGLAPGLKGANCSGRPFTGDGAGDLLYPALLAAGLGQGAYGARPDDGVVLTRVRITNAVRCVPPENKPTAAETRQCRPHLVAEMAAMPALRAVLALGRVAHEAVLAARDLRRKDHPFAHGARHGLGNGVTLWDSYHCSRYNVNTGRLTPDMFAAVVRSAAEVIPE